MVATNVRPPTSVIEQATLHNEHVQEGREYIDDVQSPEGSRSIEAATNERPPTSQNEMVHVR